MAGTIVGRPIVVIGVTATVPISAVINQNASHWNPIDALRSD